ncbi:TKL family protein kinase [Tritrichomonas foetus]|uniref:TKL family protein kinase n=1 Tax=Tritrichomonas foetus TaxID=1144522 RepID=A0A1J4JWV5_9EUKA|nr:TKL family protein kinase [Tritrichomonas foetus]|eukprot:OHT01757.1 TKL family protein kinase [Tritrichomonas foetus]
MSLNSISTLTLGQWIQHIQYEIRNLVTASKNIFVNRAVLTYISNGFRNFSNSLRAKANDERIIDNDEAELFKKLIPIFNLFKDIFSQQTESNWLQYFTEQPLTYVFDEVTKLIKQFNEIAIQLNLAESDPVQWTDVQSKTETVHDLGILQQLLENMNVPDYSQRITEIAELRERLSKEAGIDTESKKPSVLDQSVIAKSLQSFKNWEIDIDDLELQKKIGSGGFAEVLLGYRKSDGTIVAVKRLHQQQFDEYNLEMFKREVAILADLKHFAILPFVGACTKPPFCIVTQFMSGGSLFSRLHAKEAADRLSPTQLSIIALGIAYGMTYLHAQNMVHRDLKSLNILLDADDFPKICDFGMARTKSTGSDVMAGGIGTSQWMAPEVLVSQRYDEKADVYSYGIILWEMLTGDVPYRGLRDIQVAMTVINQNNRPKIPKNCPQNLAKFIRVCWQTDPDKRPEFKTIVRALESGAIAFPGTDISKLKSYVQQFASPSSPGDDDVEDLPLEIDPHSITDEQIEQLINELKTDETVIPKLAALVSNQDVISMFYQYDIMPILIEYIASCQDTHTIAHLISLLSTLLSDESLLASFLEHNGSQALLDLLPRFCTSMIPKLLDCFIDIIAVERHVFTQLHLSKIAPFLLCTDISVRQTAIKLLDDIIDKQCYDDDAIFAVVVENLLRNAMPEAKPEILLATLNLLIKITNFEGAKAQLRCVEGPDRICSLLEHEDPDILATALRLLQLLFEGTAPKQRTISAFLAQFTAVLGRADSDGQLEALNALTMLMDNTLVYKEVFACKNFAENFAQCIESQDIIVQVSALRICFAFCSNPITVDGFLCLLPRILALLKASTYAAILAAFSIAALLAAKDPVETLGEGREQLRQFLVNALTLESELTAPAVRLVGVLASTMSGADLLDQWEVMGKVASLLSSENEELNHLAVMAMTAMSAASPDSSVMLESIPLLFEKCMDPSFGFYPLICLSNITVDPINAAACVPYIAHLFPHLEYGDRVSTQRALVTLHRILMAPEAADAVQDQGVIDGLFQAVTNLWESEHSPILFGIVETLTGIQGVCEQLQQKGMVDVVKKKLLSCQLNDPNRPKYIRIRARLIAASNRT